jgi:hypothetical protein
MKKIFGILGVMMITACNHTGSGSKTKDSTTINTTNNNAADGGPNNGLGDTNTYNRMNDTTIHDTTRKK